MSEKVASKQISVDITVHTLHNKVLIMRCSLDIRQMQIEMI